MFSDHTKYHTDPMHIDNPKLNIGVKIYLYLRPLGPYVALGILGFILWLLTYIIFYFYKDFLVTQLKKDTDRGFYYKYLNYKRMIKHVAGFSFIVSSFWVVLIIIMKEWRWYTISVGCGFFTILYLSYLVKYYFVDRNEFDLFDDYVFLLKRMIGKKAKEKLKKE